MSSVPALRETAPPALHVADSLETARTDSVVYVGTNGSVLPRSEVRSAHRAALVMLGALSLGVTALGMSIVGPMGAVVGATFTALMGRSLWQPFRLRRVAAYLVADRLEEAETLAKEIHEGWDIPRVTRREAMHALAQIATVRGDLHTALARHVEVEAMYRSAREKRWVGYRIHRYAEVMTLTQVGRDDDARRRMSEFTQVPEGDYLKLLHWSCELMLAFSAGAHQLDEDELHARSRLALQVLPGAQLLALCAWAFDQIGEYDMADHLVDVTLDRWEPKMQRSMPRLDQWLERRSASL
jgi:hypothetical protein